MVIVRNRRRFTIPIANHDNNSTNRTRTSDYRTGTKLKRWRRSCSRNEIAGQVTVYNLLITKSNGGEGGIRTPGTLSGTPVFKTGAINHSATSPTCARISRKQPSTKREADASRLPS